jgi:BA14K-like protein
MERKMNLRMTLMTTAALAMLTPLIATPSFAEGRGFAGHAGIAASPRGMANAAAGGGGWSRGGGGGGGWNHGGVAMGGGGWNRGGGGWNHGGGRGWGGGGFIPGAVAGAVIGGAIANSNAYYDGGPGYYGPQYGYYDQPDYYDQGPAVAVAPDDGDSAGYCMQRYRSYDPASGTYLGFDGLRHPCP